MLPGAWAGLSARARSGRPLRVSRPIPDGPSPRRGQGLWPPTALVDPALTFAWLAGTSPLSPDRTQGSPPGYRYRPDRIHCRALRLPRVTRNHCERAERCLVRRVGKRPKVIGPVGAVGAAGSDHGSVIRGHTLAAAPRSLVLWHRSFPNPSSDRGTRCRARWVLFREPIDMAASSLIRDIGVAATNL